MPRHGERALRSMSTASADAAVEPPATVAGAAAPAAGEPAVPQRPATRAWTRLVAAAREDAARAEQLRDDAAKHVAAANAAVARRAARRTTAAQRNPPPTSDRDVALATAPDVVATPSDAMHTSASAGGPSAIAAQIDTKMVPPTPEELAPAQPWNSRVAAMERFSSALSAADSDTQRAAIVAAFVPALAQQLKDLRSMVVVAAAEALVPAAAACGPEEARALLDAAFVTVVKTKAVMAQAATRVAKAVVQHQPPVGPVRDHLLKVLAEAPHIRTRACAAECAILYVDLPIDSAADVTRRTVEIAVQDKSEEVRAAGRATFARFVEVHGQEMADALVTAMPEAVRPRIASALATSHRSEQANAHGAVRSAATTARIAPPKQVAAVNGAPGPGSTGTSAKAATKPGPSKPTSMREILRMKRLAMQHQQAQNQLPLSQGTRETVSHPAADEPVHVSENNTLESRDPVEDDDATDARKKRDDAHLSPQKTIPKRRVLQDTGDAANVSVE